MSEVETHEDHVSIARAMERDGGGFVSALARLIYRADLVNLARIKAAWPEYWATYKARAIEHSEREEAARLHARQRCKCDHPRSDHGDLGASGCVECGPAAHGQPFTCEPGACDRFTWAASE